jgi:hypothetical protein
MAVGNWVFVIAVGAFAFWVLSKFLGNIKALRGKGVAP